MLECFIVFFCNGGLMFEKIGAGALAVIPCCASKAGGGVSSETYCDPLATFVPADTYRRLLESRSRALGMVKAAAGLLTGDSAKNGEIDVGPDFGGQRGGGRYMPALHRYQGTLYSVPGVRQAVEESALRHDVPRVLILSALYGPLHPLSPIQDYNLKMDQKPAHVWDAVFPLFLEAWVGAHKTRVIHLFTGTSTAYFRTARKAVIRLLERGLIDQAVQYHVTDGSTRETPRQHGLLLHALLTGTPVKGIGIQANNLASVPAGSRGWRQLSGDN